MKNFFKTIAGMIKSRLTPRSRHPSLKELEERASSLTFICPGCGFHLQLPGAHFVETSNKSKLRGTPGPLRHARLLPLTTDQIAILEGPLNMVPHSYHAILPPPTKQITAFEEPLNRVPYIPHTNPQPDGQFSHIETNQRSQFKFPHRFSASSQKAPGTEASAFPQPPI